MKFHIERQLWGDDDNAWEVKGVVEAPSVREAFSKAWGVLGDAFDELGTDPSEWKVVGEREDGATSTALCAICGGTDSICYACGGLGMVAFGQARKVVT